MWGVQIGVVYGNPEVTPGGNALKYYASMRLEVRRTKTIEGPNKEPTGIKVRTKVRSLSLLACRPGSGLCPEISTHRSPGC